MSERWRRRHLGEGGIRKCGPRRRRSPERRPEAPGPPAPERSGAEDAAAAAAGAAAAGAGAATGGPGGGAGGRGRPGRGPGARALPEAGAEAARVHLPPRPRALPHCQRLPGRAELRVPAGRSRSRRGRGRGCTRTPSPLPGIGAGGPRPHPLQHHGEDLTCATLGVPCRGARNHTIQPPALEGPGGRSPLLVLGSFSPGYTCFFSLRFCGAVTVSTVDP